DNSVIKSTDNKISPKAPLHRKNNNATKNRAKKLFREEKWALDSPTAGSSVYEKSRVVEQPIAQKKRRQKKVVKTAKKPKTSMKHDYNLRSRTLLTPPTKLESYIT
ncbi:hypothetical protein AVEN_204488-1, partial [Araneus ventricosus]